MKSKLAKVIVKKTQGTIVRSRARWYEFGEKNNKYFLKLEKRNHRKKHITALKNEDGSILQNAKQIMVEEENFIKNIHKSKNISLVETNDSVHFFDSPNLKTLNNEEAGRCEGFLTIKECADALNKFQNNKTPGSDGLTIEFCRLFWDAIGHFVVDSFNYAYEHGHLSISQRLGIISLIPKKNRHKSHCNQNGKSLT